jgi:hypothetical protein
VRLRGLQLGKQVVVVAFAVHDVQRLRRSLKLLLACPYGATSSQRFSVRIDANVTSIQVAERTCPGLRVKHTERDTLRCHRKARVHPESARSSALQVVTRADRSALDAVDQVTELGELLVGGGDANDVLMTSLNLAERVVHDVAEAESKSTGTVDAAGLVGMRAAEPEQAKRSSTTCAASSRSTRSA